ncbi:MAG: polysaccharide deacetylase family protein [Endomicrobium sp.]|jgi:peptidoglycan/xylan/chitin deacetylase (PgdA/CDA1 family)|nr:polysaccharide deacetylase family protein [Endomicrobium sp.]
MGKIKKINIVFTVICLFVCYSNAKILYTRGCPEVKKVALTFDDGPGKATKRVLEILKEKNVKATFFMLGVRVENDTETAKKVIADNHEIGSHTYKHVNFYSYKVADKISKMEKEILKAKNVIKDKLGVDTYLMRFPYGYSKPEGLEVAQKQGYYVINWSFGMDWKNILAQEMHIKYKQAIRNGAIFLMHDLPKNDKILSFLGDFIDEIRMDGYEIVTISELLNLKQKI